MKFPTIIQQEQKDCGVTCIQMILEHYGSKIPIHKLRRLSKTNAQGVSGLGIKNCFEKLNFECLVGKTNKEIWNTDEITVPLIAHVLNDSSLPHFIVIYMIKNNQLYISDPAKGKYKVNIYDFDKIWTGVLFLVTPNHDYVEIDESIGGIKTFKNLISKYKKTFIKVILFSLTITTLSIISSFYFQSVIDYLIPLKEKNMVHLFSMVLIIINIIRSVIFYLRGQILNWLGNEMNSEVMEHYSTHTLNLPIEFFINRKSGDIISRFNDISKIIEGLANIILTLVLDTLMVLIISIVLLKINYKLFLITIMIIPILTVIILSFIDKIDSLKHQEMKSNSNLNSTLIETYKGIETIKSHSREEKISIKISNILKEYLSDSFKTDKINNVQNLMKQSVFLIFNAIILWIGTLQVIKNQLTVGQLITYNALLTFFVSSIENIINLQDVTQTAEVASKRLNEVLAIETENNKINQFNELIYKIDSLSFKKVSFSYDFQKPTLNNININLNLNEHIAFVGKSGSGKSTLAKLIVKFYDNYSGDIIVNGIEYRSLNSNEIRNKIRYISQETYLFAGSIYENIIFGSKNIPNEETVIKALKKAHIYDEIKQLPLGIYTQIEEGGQNLSGGQKRRIDIARGLLSGAEVLIFDEITNGMDPVLENKILKTLINQKEQRLIIITHNLLLSDMCDQVYVFDDGKIKEFGTPNHLNNSNTSYKKIKNIIYQP